MKKILSIIALVFVVVCFFYFEKDTKTTKHVDSSGNIEALTGAEKFALYHSNIRKSPKGSEYNYRTGYQMIEYQNLKKRADKEYSRELNWQERGPGNVSGRTRTVWVDPSDESGKSWFVGSVQGGVWKTENAGQSYVLKTPDIPYLGTATIMGCKSAPEIIYAGSGEGINPFGAAGVGIFKSSDGGETWTLLSATTNNNAFANVYRLAVHPENPDIVFAATSNNNSVEEREGFVMRSKDGGVTWEEVLYHYDIIADIIMNPNDGDVLFTGLNQEGILKSVDGGDNWDYVSISPNIIGSTDRIELAISPSNPNYVYFTNSFEFDDNIFVSDDGGENFRFISPKEDKDYYGSFGFFQNWWNKALTVDPFDPLKIYFAGTSSILSMTIDIADESPEGELTVLTDGYGFFWEYFNVNSKSVHVDHHSITFSVTDEVNQDYILINSNDGGIAVSMDKGETFTQTGDTFLKGYNPDNGNWTTVKGYNVSTFYGVDKMNGADRYVGGTQDNGSWISPEDPDENSDWEFAPSADGCEAAWHYDNPKQILQSSQGNVIRRTNDGGENWFELDIPAGGPFVTAIANSKQDADMVMVSTSEGPALSMDFGKTWKMSTVPLEYQGNSLRSPIDISLIDPRVVWAGNGVTQTNGICLSKDGGHTFEPTSRYKEQVLGDVIGIATHPADAAVAYALFGTSGQPKIIRTTDSGESWIDISGFEGSNGTSSRGFPDVPVFSLLVMPYDNNIIWAGTELGIVQSLDNGESWNLLDDGLPATAIWEMKVVNDEVVVATHGRGIWTATIPELDGYEPPTPYLASSKFVGNVFDKKLDGVIKHLSPVDSGRIIVTVETFTKTFTREVLFEQITSPTEEEFFLDLEEFEIGDTIFKAEIEITSYRDGESLTRTTEYPFYDVDTEDEVHTYEDNFDEGKRDFAFGILPGGNIEFAVETPFGFENNGLKSGFGFFNISTTSEAIFQKPIKISASGTVMRFDEIVLLASAFEGLMGLSFNESITLMATADQGQNWIEIDEYSSEEHQIWSDTYQMGLETSDDLYRKRSIRLSDYFDAGDVVYFKIELMTRAFFESWGYILDNIKVENTLAIKEEALSDAISIKTYMNPFVTSTRVELKNPNAYEVGAANMIGLDGQLFNNSISETVTSEGKMFQIDGKDMPVGMYFLKVRVGDEIVTEKIVKM